MKPMIRILLLSLSISLGLSACDKSGEAPKDLQVLEWDDLMPEDWGVEALIAEYNISDISDDDPRAVALLEKIQAMMKDAPVVEELEGKQVKLPGYVVPLELTATNIQEFLLVPYFGACVHSPPPPANQTIYVVTPDDEPYVGSLYDTVWVTGTMKLERVSSNLGDAGYRIDLTGIEPFE